MSQRRTLMAALTVGVAALAACGTGYEPSRDNQGAGTTAVAVASPGGGATGPTDFRFQTGNLPSG